MSRNGAKLSRAWNDQARPERKALSEARHTGVGPIHAELHLFLLGTERPAGVGRKLMALARNPWVMSLVVARTVAA